MSTITFGYSVCCKLVNPKMKSIGFPKFSSTKTYRAFSNRSANIVSKTNIFQPKQKLSSSNQWLIKHPYISGYCQYPKFSHVTAVKGARQCKKFNIPIVISLLQNHRFYSTRSKNTQIENSQRTDKPSNNMNSHEDHVIALEGLIGIGKSELCKRFLAAYPDDVDVYREETNEKFLQLFYSDPKKYGFALQWGMLKSRMYQLKLAQRDKAFGRNPPRKLYLWDRSMIGDYIFALWNHLLGGISKEEMSTYESEFGGSIRDLNSIPFLKDVDLFAFLNDEPALCKRRVEECRKNPSEQGIPLSYYEGLDDIHFHILLELLRKGSNSVIVVSFKSYENEHKLTRARLEEAAKAAPRVKVFDLDSPLDDTKLRESFGLDPKKVLKYTSEADINHQYQLLSSNSMSGNRIDAVLFPKDFCLVDPSSKSLNLDHLSGYNIKFYTNPFKRIVMFHLEQGSSIIFYDSKKGQPSWKSEM